MGKNSEERNSKKGNKIKKDIGKGEGERVIHKYAMK